MRSPDTRLQSEEFAGGNQFSVDITQPKGLYLALTHANSTMWDVGIGTSHSKDRLFSQVNVTAQVVANTLRQDYSISACLYYQNPNDQYWSKEQTQQLKELLAKKYSSVTHPEKGGYNSLIIKDPDVKLMYVIGLGYEDKKTAWIDNIKTLRYAIEWPIEGDDAMPFPRPIVQSQADEDQPPQLIEPFSKKDLTFLKNNPNPHDMNSRIFVKPIDAEPNFVTKYDFFSQKGEQDFRHTTQKWTQFIEDAVNAMAKVKGIPQSGKLVILPPSEVPQL